jgi:hypothetical protein
MHFLDRSMASEPQALARQPQTTPEDDYRSLCAALEASARGRAFLAEYAQRNRNADTERVLAALDGLAAQMRADAASINDLRGELRTLLTAIRLARPDIDAGHPPDKVAMLTALVDLLERRIDAMVDIKGVEPTADEPVEIVRPPLAVVPPPDEPELPIPSPFVAQPPVIAVVAAPARLPLSAAAMPEVNVVDSACPAPMAAKPASKPASKPAAPKADAPPPDPVRLLGAIMALSEDERLALFT